jgi:hypothetical protein
MPPVHEGDLQYAVKHGHDGIHFLFHTAFRLTQVIG